jgi:hypothetical protein
MSPVSHQTIKLCKGKHTTPEDGACVMELASMLAGEPFTDHPASVCPVIGSLLRSYNDAIDDSRRQALYEYASRVVGSRASANVQRARVVRLETWAEEMRRRRRTWFLFGSPLRAIVRRRKPPIDAVGTYAVHTISKHTDETHVSVLTLIDELLAIAGGDGRVSARVIAARAAERARALDASV